MLSFGMSFNEFHFLGAFFKNFVEVHSSVFTDAVLSTSLPLLPGISEPIFAMSLSLSIPLGCASLSFFMFSSLVLVVIGDDLFTALFCNRSLHKFLIAVGTLLWKCYRSSPFVGFCSQINSCPSMKYKTYLDRTFQIHLQSAAVTTLSPPNELPLLSFHDLPRSYHSIGRGFYSASLWLDHWATATHP